EEDRRLVGDLARNLPRREAGGPLADQHALAEASRMEQVLAEDRAERPASPEAERALPAGDVMRDHHPVAPLEARSLRPQRLHRAHQLMAEHVAWRGRAVLELEEVRPAEARNAE